MTSINEKNITVLAGDIGATKTDLAVYSSRNTLRTPLAKKQFPSAEYPGLEAIVNKFLSSFLSTNETKIGRASFGVAGPVVNGRAKITNLPWVMEEAALARNLGLKSVSLLNDVEAFANAVPLLDKNDLHVLTNARPAEGGTMAVVAPGTGLGEAFLVWDGERYKAFSSEGGHTDFAPTNPVESGLLDYLLERVGHVSYERVCSGIGMANIHAYFKSAGHAGDPGCRAGRISAAEDPVPLIIKDALDKNRPCTFCQNILAVFVSILGAEAGNMALKVMATGGVYLGGGIPPRILPALESGSFLASFIRKGRMSDLMKEIPVYVILRSDAALLGAARHALFTC